MNINFGMSNLIVKYLQVFLNEEYSRTVNITGTFDIQTHRALIDYLNIPNVEKIDIIQSMILDEFDEISKKFLISRDASSIIFISKDMNQETKDYMDSIRDDLEAFVYKHGWTITEFTNYNYSNVYKYKIYISPISNKNILPNNELMCMINQFNEDYYYNLAIRDGIGIDDIIHKSSSYKIAIIPCNPNQTFRISYGYNKDTPIVVGSSQHFEDNIINESLPIDNVIERVVLKNEFIDYTTSNNARNLIIQTPHTGILQTGSEDVTIPVKLGDINLDDTIDQLDRNLLSKIIVDKLEVSGLQFIACDINQDGIVDNEDLILLDKFLTKQIGTLGVSHYVEKIDKLTSGSGKLMVLNIDNLQENINIPYEEFIYDPWIIHDKFINYLLGMTINKYSDSDSIHYLQKLIRVLYKEYSMEYVGKYDDGLKSLVKKFQIDNNLYFSTGYLDIETEALMLKELNGNHLDLYNYKRTNYNE